MGRRLIVLLVFALLSASGKSVPTFAGRSTKVPRLPPAWSPQDNTVRPRGSPIVNSKVLPFERAISIRGGVVHPGGDVPRSVSHGGQELPGTKPEDAVESPPSASLHQAVITQEEAVPRPEKTVRGGIMDNFISRALGMKGNEFPKFVYMSSMMFCIIYIFTMTRDTKDALVVTNCGAEAIAFLKVYAVLPAAAAFMLIYNWASNQVGSRALFHLTITPFLAFYTLFALVVYPLRDLLHHPAGAISRDEHVLAHVINIGRFWTFAVYYVVSELWGSAGVPLLFWTCANEVTPITQAKRFYPLFAILGNLAPIASGQTMAYVTRNQPKGLDADQAFERTLKMLSGLILGAGAMIITLYEWTMDIHRKELASGDGSDASGAAAAAAKPKKKKEKMGLMESFRFLSRSKYLGYMSIMVLSYGLAMEFTEIVWKEGQQYISVASYASGVAFIYALVKKAYPDKTDYMAFMGQYSTLVGTSTFFMLLIGREVIKFLGWEVGALMTPVFMTVLALPFFGYIMLGDINTSRTALLTAVYVGMVQNILSKATKYAVFDPTKEMAYIPLDPESKVKGKAAIDVLGARLGKSGGALVQQGLVLLCGSILTGAPVLATLFALVSAMWITSVMRLSKLFLVKQAEAEKTSGPPRR